MTLHEWSALTNVAVNLHDSGGVYVIPVRRGTPDYYKLWILEDYKVSSVCAGVIWLVPIETNRPLNKGVVDDYVELIKNGDWRLPGDVQPEEGQHSYMERMARERLDKATEDDAQTKFDKDQACEGFGF